MSFLLTCSLWTIAWGQERKITGTVTANEDGTTIPGVSVVIKGSTRGTNTDAKGEYAISVPDRGARLVFSFVGSVQQEVEVGNQSVINVKLVSDSRQLSEVVVTGTGVATTKAKLGIAVESVSAKDLPQTPTASIDQALQGKIAGAQITSPNGTPGARANILLRGINTVNRGTAPIILVDGVQVTTDINSLDLSNIERVEVVQGAAAATIYGAQGANGVIQLFTKRGKEGPLRISVSNSYAQNSILNVGNLRKADLHAFVTNANNVVVGTNGQPITFNEANGTFTDNVQYNALDVNSNANKPYDQNLKYYDHFKAFFIPSHTINNSVNVSGANNRTDYSFSVSNNYQTSTLKNNGDFNRSNIVANIGLGLAKNLTFRTATQLVYTRDALRNSDRTALYSLNNTRPFADYDFKDADGNYAAYYGAAAGVNSFNPNYRSQYRQSVNNKTDIIQSFNLDYKPFKFLDLNAKYGINYQRATERRTHPNQTLNRNIGVNPNSYVSTYGTNATGEIDNFDNTLLFQNLLAQAVIKTDFREDFKLNVPITTATQVAFDYRSNVLKEYWTYATSLPTYTPFTAAQGANYRVQRDYTEPFITYGYLVNQTIDYGDLGGVSGGFRSDYSSAFGRGSTPFTFPRGSAYVRPSSLGFWQNGGLGNIVPEFKIRAAYGEAGIQPRPFDRYVTLNTRTLGSSSTFYYDPAQNNPDLDVEVSRELEIGTDFTVNGGGRDWLRRLQFSFSYWKRNTDNAIYNVDVAPSAGQGTLKDNAFSLESRGLQFSLNTTIYKGRDITWNFTTNFGRQTSEIAAVKGNGQIVVTSAAGSTNYVLRAGEKIGQLFGFVAIRSLDQILPDGTAALTEAQKAAYQVASNGYVVNKTTKQPLFSSAQYSLGDPNPLFNASFINDISYRGIVSLGFQFDWVYGNHVYNQTKSWLYRDGIHSDYAEPITINGQTGNWTAFYRGVYQAGANNGTKDYFYEDASFVRLRNISLGVDFSKFLRVPVLKQTQLVFSGRNLLTFTKYTGMDPEVSAGSITSSNGATNNENSAWDRGTDHNTMPNLRSYQATLNFNF